MSGLERCPMKNTDHSNETDVFCKMTKEGIDKMAKTGEFDEAEHVGTFLPFIPTKSMPCPGEEACKLDKPTRERLTQILSKIDEERIDAFREVQSY